MVMALHRIQVVMGYAGGHRHGSVEGRMAFVTRHALDAGVRAEFRRAMKRIKHGLVGLLLLGVALTLWQLPLTLALAHANVDRTTGARIYMQALEAEYANDLRENAKAPALWQASYDRFAAILDRLEGRDDPQSQAARVEAAFGAADLALHGLRDVKRAEGHFLELLRLLDAFELTGPQPAILRYEAHIDLGRIEAWRYAALPPGDAGRDRSAMDAHLAMARKLRDLELSALPAERTFKNDAFLAERARLLEATIEAAVGEHAVARKQLERIASLAKSAKKDDYERQELAADARAELDRLP